MKYVFLSLAIIFFGLKGLAQNNNVETRYNDCYDTLKLILTENTIGSFKKAVFVTENCYMQGLMKYENFSLYIDELKAILQAYEQVNPLKNYRFSDSMSFKHNLSIFRLLKDTLHFLYASKAYLHPPYTYDFNDFDGQKEWSNMFVTKLFAAHSGNCHSLPYLYKILADEINANCWLSLAPNHLYIKNRCEGGGWYNTELTSGTFPIDAWLITSGYISLQAVQNGIYLDTLSNQQAIALCVLDLAKEYEHQAKNYTDGFIIKCCDLSLQYFPLNVQAILLKAETMKRVYEKQVKEKDVTARDTYENMQALYIKLLDLGYREMPDKMYQQWLFSVQKEKAKYDNKKIPMN